MHSWCPCTQLSGGLICSLMIGVTGAPLLRHEWETVPFLEQQVFPIIDRDAQRGNLKFCSFLWKEEHQDEAFKEQYQMQCTLRALSHVQRLVCLNGTLVCFSPSVLFFRQVRAQHSHSSADKNSKSVWVWWCLSTSKWILMQWESKSCSFLLFHY